MTKRTCRRCHSKGPFHASYLKSHNYVCKACASLQVKECRFRDPTRLLAYRTYNSFRRRNVPISRAAVQRILEQCHYKSILSEEANPEKLCIVPYFRDISPAEEWNCVVLTRGEARSFVHPKSKYFQKFPEVISKMMQNRRAAAASITT